MASQTCALADATTLAKTSTERATIAVVQREVTMMDHIE